MKLMYLLLGLAFLVGAQAPVASVERARALLQQGKQREAAAMFASMAKQRPNDWNAVLGWGIALHMAGADAEAIGPLEAALKLRPNAPPALLALGASYLRTGQPGKAIAPLARFVTALPQDLQGRKMMIDALLLSGEQAKAIPHLEALLEREADRANVWYELGRAYEAGAREDFALLEKTAPESGPFFALLADSRSKTKQSRAALFFYRKALEKAPQMRGLRPAVAEIYRAEGHPEWALREEADEARLPALPCQVKSAECEFRGGWFRQALALARKDASALGLYWRIQAQNALAREAFEKLRALGESVEWARFVAESHRDAGRREEAVAAWQAVRRLDPANAQWKRELAAALLDVKNYAEAEKIVKSLLKAEPEATDVNQLAGDLYLLQQMAEEAIPYLRKAGSSLPARASLARALLQAGKAEEAIPHAEAALALDQDGSLHFQLAQAYRGAGKAEQAAKALARYQEIQSQVKAQQAALEAELTIAPPR